MDQVPAQHVDLLVLGWGKGGKTLAADAARRGLRVAVVEQSADMVGGSCINVACVPTKFLIHESRRHRNHQRDDDGAAACVTYEVAGRTQTVVAEAVLLAVGRVPETQDLGLEVAGVETDEAGYVVVDERLRSTAPGVFALGDVNGGPQFTYVSLDDARIVADQLFGDGARSTADRVAVPSTMFLTPPLARVGLTEAEARAGARGARGGAVRRGPGDHAAPEDRGRGTGDRQGRGRRGERPGARSGAHARARAGGDQPRGDGHAAPGPGERAARRDLHPPVVERGLERDPRRPAVTPCGGMLLQVRVKNGSLAISILALVVATSMTSAAAAGSAAEQQAATVGPAAVKNGEVTTKKIRNGAVTTKKLKNGAVGTKKLKNGAVGAKKLKNGAVTNAKIANGTIEISKLSAAALDALQGAQGPKGDTGPAGPPGAVGSPGLDGVSGYQVVTETKFVTANGWTPMTVLCPAGKKAVGGGAIMDSGAASTMTVYGSGPAGNPLGQGWTTYLRSTSTTDTAFEVSAICVSAN